MLDFTRSSASGIRLDVYALERLVEYSISKDDVPDAVVLGVGWHAAN